ncbi:hypothetical protein PAMP_018375 [Pampus punctatissimus]
MEHMLLCKSTAGCPNGFRFVSAPVNAVVPTGARMISSTIRRNTRNVIYAKGEGQFSYMSSTLPTDHFTEQRQVNPFIVMKLMPSDAWTVSSIMRGTWSGATPLFIMVLLKLAQCQEVPLVPAQRFACERILKEDVNAELIPKPPFVSFTLASAAMRHRGTDMLTIDDEEERMKEDESGFIFIYLFFF